MTNARRVPRSPTRSAHVIPNLLLLQVMSLRRYRLESASADQQKKRPQSPSGTGRLSACAFSVWLYGSACQAQLMEVCAALQFCCRTIVNDRHATEDYLWHQVFSCA